MGTNKKVVYCHFAFKRPKGNDFGYFAVAFYWDYAGTKLITHKTKKLKLWLNNQFVTAIQSYENALQTIFELQGQMREAGISLVMLVTDNSTLAGWIENPRKNKNYFPYMERAVNPYRTGSFKEIVVGVGLCEVRKKEMAYKYCRENLVSNTYSESTSTAEGYKLDIGEYQSIVEILSSDKSKPEIIEIEDV